MAENSKALTTGEFSKITGIAVSTITQMLRQGKIQGEKSSGKWAIHESELQKRAMVTRKEHGELSDNMGSVFNIPAVAGKGYDIEAFAQMTYLTEKGVRQWLKTGRLSGSVDSDGNVLVDAANLDRPELQHLLRK
ncbi:helix-turn-helix domain-containing protein [uncultured Desulfosarcina sp.]|uniref:helix-turn-helix domain-containing protein n=1 Tax=uncultured Desulfosarcina sp. TaxID=218289 RepID=UPI0029C8E2EA|nr:helix-turn-helix domain-containing protein [uncultured Desulfosarcina sp.]